MGISRNTLCLQALPPAVLMASPHWARGSAPPPSPRLCAATAWGNPSIFRVTWSLSPMSIILYWVRALSQRDTSVTCTHSTHGFLLGSKLPLCNQALCNQGGLNLHSERFSSHRFTAGSYSLGAPPRFFCTIFHMLIFSSSFITSTLNILLGT